MSRRRPPAFPDPSLEPESFDSFQEQQYLKPIIASPAILPVNYNLMPDIRYRRKKPRSRGPVPSPQHFLMMSEAYSGRMGRRSHRNDLSI